MASNWSNGQFQGSQANRSSPSPFRSGQNPRQHQGLRKLPSTSSPKTTATFAPNFISAKNTTGSAQSGDEVAYEPTAIDGADFSGKRWVWVKDTERAFIKGHVTEEDSEGNLTVLCDDHSERIVHRDNVDKVNPSKFDRAADMAELTHLNEASVVHNLHMRYQADMIYTYSGLFLVAVNPYCPLPIYSNEYVEVYKNRSREDNQPHIFAISDMAFRNLLEEKENQSILVTGESGAGKTENTKKVIQYLASVALDHGSSRTLGTLEQQILRANPILEAFGNAQTVRNNNSSRFGKFIRIEFTRSGQISGAYIDWYLLEKSRVVKQSSGERNYHVFYQFLRGATREMRNQFLLGDSVNDYSYTASTNTSITGVNDAEEFRHLIDAFHIMGFTPEEQNGYFRTIAAVLHLGNLTVHTDRSDGARLPDSHQVDRICSVLGIAMDAFTKGLLNPRVKAGREWVNQRRSMDQVKQSVDALSKGIYERSFGKLVSRINTSLERRGDESGFIGVLDIAGFEIFESNSFEQLCINYTNEKLQQFFNHHMFVLEQEEYAREKIEWKFIDFGHDLQPTIDLIELPNPIGIFSCLDEDCVMPKATDKTFTDKLHSLWDKKSPKYRSSLLRQGFVLTHYAAEVEYLTEGWLEKNKDPLNDNITRLLASSRHSHIADLFADCAEDADQASTSKTRVKKGLFRTVAQRHKEQLSSLMNQLHSTHPHFVRCIIPNHMKKPKKLDSNLVLDQLRCNGVLEGIRIARTGFPNRLPFAEFRQRYEVLTTNLPQRPLDGQQAASLMLEMLALDPSQYRIGLSKVFFRAGVLAELEEQRDTLVRTIIIRFQSISRGYLKRRQVNKLLYRAEAKRIICKNFNVYLDLCENNWWKLFMKTKPLLGAAITSGEIKKKDQIISKMEIQLQKEVEDRNRLEDERRRADSELVKVRQVLEAERALALDKDEIFKRLQEREADLSEKLAGALADQDDLEDQLDDLMIAKKKVSEQANKWRNELEQAGVLISKLEEEKRILQGKVDEISQELQRKDSELNATGHKEGSLLKEVNLLKSHLSLKDRKIQEFESYLAKSDKKLEEKLHDVTRNFQESQKKNKELGDENQRIRTQLNELAGTSSEYENLVRRKESELSIVRADLKKHDIDRKAFEYERKTLVQKQDEFQSKLRNLELEISSLKSQKSVLERELHDSRKLLEAKVSEDAKLGQGRKLLDEQIKDLKSQLLAVKEELEAEKRSQSKALQDAETLLHKLKIDHDALQIAKVTIEKELYSQQDSLRRALEARSQVEKEKREIHADLKDLQNKMMDIETNRQRTEELNERSISRQTNEIKAGLMKELEKKDKQLEEVDNERLRLSMEVKELLQSAEENESFRRASDQAKKRLEQEISTLRARLTSSENDNRSLQNKIQQKNLEVAKSSSKASEQYRTKIVAITAEKSKAEEQEKLVRSQLHEAQSTIDSLQKQKEKLSLDLEDLNHEISREHKSTRNMDKLVQNLQTQLAEATQSLEAERQSKTQAHANTRKLQNLLDTSNNELNDSREQLLALHKVLSPTSDAPQTWESTRRDIKKNVNLALELEQTAERLRASEQKNSATEAKLSEMRKRHETELREIEHKYSMSRRTMLNELGESSMPMHGSSPRAARNISERQTFSPPKAHLPLDIPAPVTSDGAQKPLEKEAESTNMHKIKKLTTELEAAQENLKNLEIQNQHLQKLLDLPIGSVPQDDSAAARRLQRLERENSRLHDQLDDEAGKLSALESAMRSGQLSMGDIQTKSHEELFDLINAQEKSRKVLVNVHKATVDELTEAKAQLEKLKLLKSHLEVELRDYRSELEDFSAAQEQERSSRAQLLSERTDLQIRLDAELSRSEDLSSSLALYKARSEEYFNKLEQAEIAVLKAGRTEAFAKAQIREAEDTSASILADRKQLESVLEDLQRQNQRFEEKIEDLTADLSDALHSKKRLQHELEDYRNRHAIDLEDKETTIEQTRKKYQHEISALSEELEAERLSIVHIRGENQRLREEFDDLRAKWDDEVMNSNSWAKEKSRLETKLGDLTKSHQEAVASHNDSQARVVSLLSQVRSLRSSLDEMNSEKDLLQKEKRALEQRLADASQRLEELANSDSPSLRTAAETDRQILDLRATVSRQEDVAATALEKMRRAEALVAETQKDIATERETNQQLHKDKAALEKSVKDLQIKLLDLETKDYSTASKDVRFLHSRIQELEQQIEEQEAQRSKSERSVRNVDRTVRDLQAQIDRKEKANSHLEEDIVKHKEKIERLLITIDELQSSDSNNQLLARRAEREMKEEREKCLRLERELEGWKGLRMHKSHHQSLYSKESEQAQAPVHRAVSKSMEAKTFL